MLELAKNVLLVAGLGVPGRAGFFFCKREEKVKKRNIKLKIIWGVPIKSS